MAGRWKTVFVWGVIAAAVLSYIASFKLPVVAAMEQGMAAVSDQFPALANDTVSTVMTGTGEQKPTANDVSTSDSDTTSASDNPTVSMDPASPAALTPEEQLPIFMSTRVGLVSSGTTNFPAHDVDVTGEFVFQTPSIYGSHFNANIGRQIPTGYSAFTSYYDGTMNGFTLYKNMTHAPFGDCYLAMSADGPVSFNGLSIELTELYAQQLAGVRTYLITDFWTTDPGEDLPLGVGEEPPASDAAFYGDNFKATVIKMTANYIAIPNFSLSFTPGKK